MCTGLGKLVNINGPLGGSGGPGGSSRTAESPSIQTYTQLEKREVPVRCFQGDQKSSLRLVNMNWATLAKYKSIELLGDHGLCPLILFSHCVFQFVTSWHIQ